MKLKRKGQLFFVIASTALVFGCLNKRNQRGGPEEPVKEPTKGTTEAGEKTYLSLAGEIRSASRTFLDESQGSSGKSPEQQAVKKAAENFVKMSDEDFLKILGSRELQVIAVTAMQGREDEAPQGLGLVFTPQQRMWLALIVAGNAPSPKQLRELYAEHKEVWNAPATTGSQRAVMVTELREKIALLTHLEAIRARNQFDHRYTVEAILTFDEPDRMYTDEEIRPYIQAESDLRAVTGLGATSSFTEIIEAANERASRLDKMTDLEFEQAVKTSRTSAAYEFVRGVYAEPEIGTPARTKLEALRQEAGKYRPDNTTSLARTARSNLADFEAELVEKTTHLPDIDRVPEPMRAQYQAELEGLKNMGNYTRVGDLKPQSVVLKESGSQPQASRRRIERTATVVSTEPGPPKSSNATLRNIFSVLLVLGSIAVAAVGASYIAGAMLTETPAQSKYQARLNEIAANLDKLWQRNGTKPLTP